MFARSIFYLHPISGHVRVDSTPTCIFSPVRSFEACTIIEVFFVQGGIRAGEASKYLLHDFRRGDAQEISCVCNGVYTPLTLVDAVDASYCTSGVYFCVS